MTAFKRLKNDPYFYQSPWIDEPIAMLRDENKNGRIEDAEIFIYTKDHLGSVKDITDLNGSLIQRYHYSAYGITKIEKDDHNRPTKVVENPYAYTSREFVPELGIYHYRERWYWPKMQIFISLDPISFASGESNLYVYSGKNPVLLTDPYGLDYQVCHRPLAGTNFDVYPLRHDYIKFDDGSTISWGPEQGTSGPGKNNSSDSGGTCGSNQSTSQEQDQAMKDWANQNQKRNYSWYGYNCRSFVKDAIQAGQGR